MAPDFRTSGQATPNKAQHLLFLCMGSGGFRAISTMSKRLSKIAMAKRTSLCLPVAQPGSLTYDGIEVGAERVAKEIEDMLEELRRDGHKITKFSIVGYSLGGLVARYAIGLLDHRAILIR